MRLPPLLTEDTRIRVRTDSGRIDAHLTAPGWSRAATFESSTGDVTVSFPPEAAAVVTSQLVGALRPEVRLAMELLARGVLVNPNEKFYVSIAHTEADVERETFLKVRTGKPLRINYDYYAAPTPENKAGIDWMVRHHGGQTLAAVCHSGVLDIVYRRATGRPLTTPRDFKIPNCALNWFHFDGQGWHLEAWGDRHHLHEVLTEPPE